MPVQCPESRARSQRGRNAGFTLIELMIGLAIVAILTAIAIPSYTDSVRKSRRPWRTESPCCWRVPSPMVNSYSPRSPSSLLPYARFRSSHNFASCFGTARCPDAVARPAGIREGVSRRTSGRTLSRSARGDRSGAERGPPSGP